MSADDNMSDVEGGGAGAAISSVPTGPKDIVNTVMYVEPAVLPTSLGTDIKGIHVKCLDCKAWDKVTKLSNGYTNHLSHWRSCVKEKYDELLAERWKERCRNSTRRTSIFFVKQKTAASSGGANGCAGSNESSPVCVRRVSVDGRR